MKKKILHCDNEPHFINLMKLTIGEQYDYTGVYTARECLAKLEKQEYDLLITGIMMPGVNGYELCQAAREKYKELPIIILSAKGQMNDKLHAIDVGADDYITKPFDPMEIERRIKINIGTRRDL